jgi:hypothetical protein
MVTWLLFNFNLSNSLALQTVASMSNLGHVVEMEVLQRVLACCGHIPKRANNTMRGRLWCVSCNAAVGKRRRGSVFNVFTAVVKVYFTRLIVQTVVCSLMWNKSYVHAVFTEHVLVQGSNECGV